MKKKRATFRKGRREVAPPYTPPQERVKADVVTSVLVWFWKKYLRK